MKKNNIFTILGVVAIVALLAVSFFVKDDSVDSSENNTLSSDPNSIIENAQKESDAAKKKDLPELQKIKVADYLNYYNASTKQLILLASPTCHYCQIAEPIIGEIVKEKNIDIKYLDSSIFTDEETADFVRSDEFFSNGFGTPLLMYVGNGSIIDKVDGLTDKAHYLEFFKSNGIIE